MKKIFFIVVLFTAISIQHSFAQDNTKTTSLSALLNSYLDIKNALVATDAATASVKAGELAKAIEGIDMKALSEADHNAFMPLNEKLAFDARHISESKDISHQREHFSALSNNIYKLAKAVKLSTGPVYQEYCPMKKMYWLSSEAAIKNPYYGKAMLTCGKVTETIE
ncbi:MAG: DUF3347 domain-containing protein [Chitinophagaceae bacterium]